MTAGKWVRKAPSTAQRRLASAATNEAAPLTRAAHYNTLLIKTTHVSTPVCLDLVRKTRKRNTWRMDLCQITVYDALRVGQYVDQSSSRGLEKFVEDILTSPEIIRAQTLHFKPNFKFSRLNFLGDPRPSCGKVTPVPKPWSISSACKNLEGQHPLRAEM